MKQDKSQKNYELKSDAVESLAKATADEQAVPEYSKEELEKYRGKKKFRIPDPVKILLLKMWFPGAVCFFIMFGLGIGSLLDMLFVLGVALGLVTDLLLNNVIRFLARFPGEFDEWMLFPRKGMGSFLLNILYSFLIIFCVYLLYSVINYGITQITGQSGNIYLGVEPVLFGVFCMGFDMLFIGIKRLIRGIFNDARNAAGR